MNFNLEEYKQFVDSQIINNRKRSITRKQVLDYCCQFELSAAEFFNQRKAYIKLNRIFDLKNRPIRVPINTYLLYLFGYKRCCKCKEIKELTLFYKDSSNWNNLRKECIEGEKEKRKKYYQDNKEEILERHKEYRENNKEKILEHKKEYYQNNKEKYRAYWTKREALKRNQLGPNYIQEEEERYRKIITYLNKRYNEFYVLDHYISISKEGLHEASNWQIITAKENGSKFNKDPEEFYSSEIGKEFLQDKRWSIRLC